MKEKLQRRKFVALVGAAGAIGVAGCGSPEDDGGGQPGDGEPAGNGGEEEETGDGEEPTPTEEDETS
jgi:thiamine transport system substrate-binding protein